MARRIGCYSDPKLKSQSLRHITSWCHLEQDCSSSKQPDCVPHILHTMNACRPTAALCAHEPHSSLCAHLPPAPNTHAMDTHSLPSATALCAHNSHHCTAHLRPPPPPYSTPHTPGLPSASCAASLPAP